MLAIVWLFRHKVMLLHFHRFVSIYLEGQEVGGWMQVKIKNKEQQVTKGSRALLCAP